MLLPRTKEVRNMVRIVMLIKQGVQVELIEDLMDTKVAAIWVKLSVKGKKPLAISGVYREHRYMKQGTDSDSNSDRQQLERWTKFVTSWKKAAGKYEVVVVGDTNIDFLRWDSPDPQKKKMVDKVKQEVETLGFYQLIEGFTRCWNEQPESLIDQCWVNIPQKLIYMKNIVQAFSDHNLIIVCMRTKDRQKDRHEIVKRVRKNFDVLKYKSDITQIDWSELLENDDIDIINSQFVEKLSEVLDKVAPIKTIQRRQNYKSWVSQELKQQMQDRDELRERARITGRNEDWILYRQARNLCSKQVGKTKSEYYLKLYGQIEQENNTKRLYSLTGELLDTRTGNLPQQFL